MARACDQRTFSEAFCRANQESQGVAAPEYEELLAKTDLQIGASASSILDSIPIMSAIGLGFYYAWVYLACFSPKLFPVGGATQDMAFDGALASFAGYLLMVAACVFFWSHIASQKRRYVLVFSMVTSLGTALVALASLVNTPEVAQGLAIGASICAGLGSGYILVRWAQLFVSSKAHASLQIAIALLSSFVMTSVVLWAPFEPATVAIALLPLVSGCTIIRASKNVPFEQDRLLIVPDDMPPYRLPLRLALGLIAMGLVYGLAYGFTFDYAEMGIEVSISCLLVNGFLGSLILVYTIRTRKNFGYSSINMAILPLAVFAQCLIAVFRVDMLPFSFFVMRSAYAMFDILLWLQLPKVYARIGTIRTFLMSRLLLEGSAAVGVVIRQLLTFTGFEVFEQVALAATAFLLVALTLAFRGESVGSVWDLMPTPVLKTGRFREACRQIEDEYALTRRESEIMELILRGRNGTFVQDKLVISKSTFQTHMRNLYHKLDVHSNQELLDMLEQRLLSNRNHHR